MPAPAAAQDYAWYAGVSLASQRVRFEPFYTFENGDPARQFDNRATGLQTNILIGQRFRRDSRFSLGWQGTVGMHAFKWSLSIPDEPADIAYSTPYTMTATIVPEVRLGRLVSAFASLGAGAARVHQVKTAPTTSTYDFDELQPACVIGGGLRFRAGPRADLIVQYDELRTSSYEFDTFTAAGVRVEHFKDKPHARGLSFGAAVRF